MTSARARQMPTMVVLDLDDTLYAYEPCNRAAHSAMVALAAAETKLAPAAISEALSTARATVKSRLGATGSSHSRLLYAYEALAALGLGNQLRLALNMEQEFWRTYILEMRLRPGAAELLTAVRYQHVRIAVVTDLTSQIQYRKLVHLGLDSVVDLVVVSEECAGDKSSLAPFRALAERTSPDARRNVWFVGDGPADAPVSRLIDEGLIDDGFGWILGGAADEYHDGWSSLSEVEAAFTSTF